MKIGYWCVTHVRSPDHNSATRWCVLITAMTESLNAWGGNKRRKRPIINFPGVGDGERD